jgi:SAM-dependent methyltransferase
MNMSTATIRVDARSGSLGHALEVLRCTRCNTTDLTAGSTGLLCPRCEQRYEIKANIIDALPNPTKDVVDELRGMMRENNITTDLRDYMIRKVEKVRSFEDCKKFSATEVFDYHGSTEINFHQALARIPLTGQERVLEIGGQGEYPFLDAFRKKGCTCFAANIHFWYDDDQARRDWPVRVLADMHDLPFKAESFDVVLYSATTHHGAPVDAVFREAARVTKPGGWVINVNEPIRGALKHAFSGKKIEKGEQDTHRDDLVHEHEYSIFEYLRAFRRAGLTLEASLFSDYYDQRLSQERVNGVRFARLAKVASRLWKQPIVRTVARGPGLWVAQATIGLQMNVVLRKRDERV